jgi:hypothetical protein
VFIVFLFLGQVTGTAAGAKVYNAYGWRACSAVSMGYVAFQFVVLLARGPHCADDTWFGWEGGLKPIRRGGAPSSVPTGGAVPPPPADVEPEKGNDQDGESTVEASVDQVPRSIEKPEPETASQVGAGAPEEAISSSA